MTVALNKKVPNFSAAATGGEFNLAALAGKTLVLYFYPKDNTPGCTTEAQQFSALNNDFANANAIIVGVSRDSLKSHDNFIAKQQIPYSLISDHDETVCELFGVMKLKNMYGKQVRGIERSTFVIDAQGKLVQEWRGVKVPGHADEVLAFVQSLG
ncbi:peroxiredoxin [Fluviibacter phosphoraccumulans]|uniref:thioredoxin-dependent peroxiredoxin n=1 Tax=Fluviibacter phosphoraccumulans TaxID=1751046 RepID=A0A7R6RD98_9RHOO|nr:peroxiredoxin [Fluviibacter phosphoraccumulans]BBU68856.1 peroxiredoxin [Fluviibacter phosphoraccumulans]BBU71991.1 peroxiredoxin [Fluviibacter phosphoraccumulans]